MVDLSSTNPSENQEKTMEKRRLDLNAPLLSARRFTSPRSSPEQAQWRMSKRESEAISKPISIPFHWEQTPGRPKNEPQTVAPTPKLISGIHKLPPGSQSGPSVDLSGDKSGDHSTTIFRKLNDTINCKGESSSSGEESYMYSDAHSSLSPMTAWSNSKPTNSSRFCADEQTREFMMSQFLPAAKAATLEKPLKKVMISEKPEEERKMVSGEILKKSLIKKQNGSNGSSDFSKVDIKEDEEISSVFPVKKSGRHSRGINIPGIYVNLKNKLSLMRSKSQPSTPKGEEKRFQRKTFSGPLNKNTSQVTPKKKFYSGLISRDTRRVESSYNSRPSNVSYHQLINLPTRLGFSHLRRSRSLSTSSCHNVSPKFHNIGKKEDASKIASSRKMFMALQDVSRSNQVNENLVKEKTLHVDSTSRRSVKSDQEEGRKLSSGYADVKQWIKGGERSANSSIGGECGDLLKSHLRPPLPKSPSESWLSRTLPSIQMGSPTVHSRINSPIHYWKQGRRDDRI